MGHELPAHGHREHVALCLEGKLNTELKDGRVFVLKPGMSYQAGAR
jgi:quercetin dioxygenase-like cupin family protein